MYNDEIHRVNSMYLENSVYESENPLGLAGAVEGAPLVESSDKGGRLAADRLCSGQPHAQKYNKWKHTEQGKAVGRALGLLRLFGRLGGRLGPSSLGGRGHGHTFILHIRCNITSIRFPTVM